MLNCFKTIKDQTPNLSSKSRFQHPLPNFQTVKYFFDIKLKI